MTDLNEDWPTIDELAILIARKTKLLTEAALAKTDHVAVGPLLESDIIMQAAVTSLRGIHARLAKR